MLLYFHTIDQATVKTERKTITIDYSILEGIRIIWIKGLCSASPCRSRNRIIAVTNTIMSLEFQKSFLSKHSNQLCGYTEKELWYKTLVFNSCDYSIVTCCHTTSIWIVNKKQWIPWPRCCSIVKAVTIRLQMEIPSSAFVIYAKIPHMNNE